MEQLVEGPGEEIVKKIKEARDKDEEVIKGGRRNKEGREREENRRGKEEERGKEEKSDQREEMFCLWNIWAYGPLLQK